MPIEKNTFYTQEFTQKKTLPEIRKFEPRENFRRTSARFDGRTTYKDHHKHWVGQKQVPFGELPSFVGECFVSFLACLQCYIMENISMIVNGLNISPSILFNV